MTERVSALDWSSTSLGPTDEWPQSLRTAVGTVLNAPVPMALWWGRELTLVYNDAYAPLLGPRHPGALGRSGPDVWREAWPRFEPLVKAVLRRGETIARERDHFILERQGRREDAWFTWSFSPVPDESGGVGGLLSIAYEDTGLMRAEAALHASEEQHRVVLRSLDEGVLVSDAGGAIVMANASAQRILGLTCEQMRGVDSFDLRWQAIAEDGSNFPPQRHPAQVALRSGEPVMNVVLGLRRGDGTRIWVSVNAIPLIDPRGGQVSGVVTSFLEVTEHKRREARRRENETRHAAALAVARLGTFDWDVRSGAVVLDERSREIFGFAPHEGTRQEELFARIHPDDFPRVFAAAQSCQADLSGLETEYRIVLPDGAVRTIVSMSDTTAAPDKTVLRIFGVFGDISERRQAEAALRESEERYRRLVETAHEGIWAIDAEGRTTYVNRRMAELLGYTPQEMMGRLHTDFMWEQDRPRGDVEMDRRREGKAAVWDQRYRRKDGGELWTIASCSTLYDAEGRVAGALGMFTDISERVRAEAQLRQSEKRLRQVADTMPQMVWVTLPDGYHEYYNRRWYEFTGMPEGSTEGDGWNAMFHPDDQGRAWERWRHSLATGEAYEVEYRLRRHDGQYRWTLGRAMPVRDEQGRIERWFGTCTDIHEQKLHREELARAKEEADRASLAKSDFLATLSHEMRTPLTPVLLTVSLMESHPDLPEDLREDVAAIRRNVELESRLISDLLDLTRIEKGKLQLDEQEVDVHLLVRAAVAICQREASAQLEVELRAQRHIVRGDSTRLQQVFWNLISNAIKFTPPTGSITVRSHDAPDGRIRIEVADTGAGIDADVLPRLFTAFEQGHARAGKQRAGLGLGLAISRRLAEAHGGTITASSQGVGRGATFTVDLPVITPSRVPATDGSAPPAEGGPAEKPALDLLLVEDHEPTLRVMTTLLRRLGHRVTGAMSVATATAAAGHRPFDLIISDLGLPDGSGLDLMRQLKDQYAGRAIALTGYGMEGDIAASRAAGFAEHLTKPVDLAALEAAITCVSSAAPRPANRSAPGAS